ncbi:MAG TPA: SRPBCC domain-containing protein, partial [Longimicrobium sp.]
MSSQAPPEPGSAILSSRLIGVPRATVFQAFLDPDVLARWWGPKGFTNTFEEFDPRPGGTWRFVMHGPDGNEYALTKKFVEVAAPERISLRHLDPVHGFLMEMLFAEEGSGTRLTWRMHFDSAE